MLALLNTMPKCAERIILRRGAIDAGVAAHRAVVEAIQVDAFAVDFFEAVAFVSGLIDVAGRIDANRRSAVFDID